jgi:hypothetical protein
MQVRDAWPPKQQQTAEHHEQDESEVEKKDEVGESAVTHARNMTLHDDRDICRDAALEPGHSSRQASIRERALDLDA